ncbi:4 Hydroxybutyrate coenzyme A transferase [Echinococcus multilocularis]|uniref:4 Hydroxybutyrate coenzyme A transferase n=1 Tax=Echinococcus multilocularis TaxID=6211 RepID=A0A0S4MKB5_ECHMU|nr:4 Hydroxybutyrate coenzyme A transferase [Echinococcus multilocularis]
MMLYYTNPRIMSATTSVGCPKMLFAAKTSSAWLGNLNYRRLFSLTLRYFTNTHEPSAPKPDHYPKWATSASEIFAELEDGICLHTSSS